MMKEQISALADGEISAAELDQLLNETSQHEIHESLRRYEVVSAAIQQRDAEPADEAMVSRIMAGIETTVPEGRTNVVALPRRKRRWMIPAAAAASLAAATVVFDAGNFNETARIAENREPTTSTPTTRDKLALAGNPYSAATALKLSSPSQAGVLGEDTGAIPELDQYLLQHSELASAGRINPTMSYARLVSHEFR